MTLTETKSLLDKLTEFYYLYEYKEGGPLPLHEAYDVIAHLLISNRYNILQYEGELVGYIEAWRVTENQLGKLLADEQLKIKEENISDGPLCYVNNIVIHPELRGSRVINQLIVDMYDKNKDVDIFVWHQRSSKHAPIRIYLNKELKRFSDRYKEED